MSRSDLEQVLMRRIVGGLVGWATFYQASGTGRHYSEYLFYQHIEWMAVGRGWRVRQQHKIIGQRSVGAPSTVDFVIYRRPGSRASREGLLFVEVKYLRGDNPSQDLGYLWDDVEKLRSLVPTGLVDHATFAKCGPPAKFLLVVGQVGDLKKILSCNPQKLEKVKALKMLNMAMQDKPPDSIYWAQSGTYFSDELQWRAMAISSRKWPT